MGPCGKLLKPYGDFDFEDAVRLFAQIVRVGAASGVDLIFIETMSDSYETKAALLAAKEKLRPSCLCFQRLRRRRKTDDRVFACYGGHGRSHGRRCGRGQLFP